jgi:hypothetical protein
MARKPKHHNRKHWPAHRIPLQRAVMALALEIYPHLTMRMGMRRFTRLTNGFSRKVENLADAVSLHFMHYNFARPHQSLKERYPRTPAMAAGVADHIWTLEEIASLLD